MAFLALSAHRSTWVDAEIKALSRVRAAHGGQAAVALTEAALAAEQGSSPLRAIGYLESAAEIMHEDEGDAAAAAAAAAEVQGWISTEMLWDPGRAGRAFEHSLTIRSQESPDGVRATSAWHFRLRITLERISTRHRALLRLVAPRDLCLAERRELARHLSEYEAERALPGNALAHRLTRLREAGQLLGLPGWRADDADIVQSRIDDPHVWGLADSKVAHASGRSGLAAELATLAVAGYASVRFAPAVAQAAALLAVALEDSRMTKQTIVSILDALVLALILAHERHPLYREVLAEYRKIARALIVDNPRGVSEYFAGVEERIRERQGMFATLAAWDHVDQGQLPELVGAGGLSAEVIGRFVREITPGLTLASRPGGDDFLGVLTPREREAVTHLTLRGLSDKEIATAMGGISVKTAERHVGSAMRKLACASRAELVVLIRDYVG